MFIIKLPILLLICASSFLVGLLISKKYINREKELKDLKVALTMFETKMKFTYESIPEIFREISEKMQGNIGDIFKNTTNKMQDLSAEEAWNNSIDEIQANITKEDKDILKNLGRLLGKTDIEGQISEIRLVNQFLDNQIEIAGKERQKNEKMYKTLGGVVGLAIVIILI